MTDQVFASLPLLLFAFAQSQGMDRDELFAIAKLSPEDLADPDGLVPYECLVDVWTELLARYPERPLGLTYARLVSPEALGVVGYVVRHARTMRQAIDAYARFSRLADPHLEVELLQEGDRARLTLRHEARVEAMGEILDMMVVGCVKLAREFVGGAVEPLEVCFRHGQRHDASLYREALGPVPVRFEAGETSIAFAASLLDRSIRGADPRIGAYLEQHAQALLEQLPDTTVEGRVRRAIDERLLVGEVDQRDIAKALGMSVRSLQRALREAGTSFSAERDRVRRERAEVLLRRPELSAGEVAFMLGYQDPRAFYRSFRRWTGRTPTEFRRDAPAR